MTLKVVSLFSGCGGLDLGFLQEGFSLIYACDNDPSAVKCFNANFEHQAILRDVQDKAFLNDLYELKETDIVLGGFPCQGFSKSGPKQKNDPRNMLYSSMVKAVKLLKPKVFIAENVDGMAQNYKGEYVSQIKNDFSKIGYSVEPRILNAVDFGVPQYRRRIIFIGINETLSKKTFNWPEPTHQGKSRNGEFKSSILHGSPASNSEKAYSNLSNPLTIKDAISDLIQPTTSIPDHKFIAPKKNQIQIIKRIGKGQKLCNVRFAETSVFTWQIPEVFGEVTDREKKLLETIGKNRRKKKYGKIPNGNPLSVETVNELAKENFEIQEFEALNSKGYLKKKNGKYDLKGAMFCSGLYKRPKWDEPSPTIITVFYSPRYFVHPLKNRPFTIREVARLQSFPDSFKFLESNISEKDAYRLIGNAVPPRLANHIAKSVFKFLEQENKNEISKSRTEYRRNVQRI